MAEPRRLWVVVVSSRDRSNRPETTVWQNGFDSLEEARARVEEVMKEVSWTSRYTGEVFEDEDGDPTWSCTIEPVSVPEK
jgi:hypothetical protein